MSDKNPKTDKPLWVAEVGNSLDRSLDELDQPVREQLARRRKEILRTAKKNRLIKRTAWVGAAAASMMAIVIIPNLYQPKPLLVQEDLSPLLQHMELLEDMEILEAMGEEPSDV